MASNSVVMPLQDFTSGQEIVSAQHPISSAWGFLFLAVDRADFTAATGPIVTVQVDLSLDNAVTWSSQESARATQDFGAFPITLKTSGGLVYSDVTDPEGVGLPIATISSVSTTIPEVGSTSRVMRARFRALQNVRTRVLLRLGTDGADE